MNLSENQIYRYATEIAREIGEAREVRDIIYGGVERYDYYYANHGLDITNVDERIEIAYEEYGPVFDSLGPGEKPRQYIPGEWEQILDKLHTAVPRIVAQQQYERMQAETRRREWRRVKRQVEECVKTLPMEFAGDGSTSKRVLYRYVYKDETIKVKKDDSYRSLRIRVYEYSTIRERHWYGTKLKRVSELVFDTDGDGLYLEGDWLEHLIEITEEIKEKQRGAKLASSPSIVERLEEIRREGR